MVSGNPYHSPSEVAGGVRGFHNDLFMPVLSKAEKSMRVTRAGMVVCTFWLPVIRPCPRMLML